LTQLTTLRDLAPTEGNVYYMLSQTQEKLGDKKSAMINLTHALDLSNRTSGVIREAISRLFGQIDVTEDDNDEKRDERPRETLRDGDRDGDAEEGRVGDVGYHPMDEDDDELDL